MTRPLIPRSQLRGGIKVYLAPAEATLLDAKAHEAGLPLSTYLRKVGLGARLRTVPQPNAQKWAELARLASNLSKLAKLAHMGRIEVVDPAALDALHAAVQDLRADLIGAGGCVDS